MMYDRRELAKINRNWDPALEFVFFGATQIISDFVTLLPIEISVRFIIDNDVEKQKNGYLGYKVFDKHKIESDRYKIIITSVSVGARQSIKSELENIGLVEDEDFIQYDKLLALWNWKYKDLIYSDYVEMMITSRCTLKCIECGLYIPRYRSPKDRELSAIIADIDQYFEIVGQVRELRILGGEPFIHKSLLQIIDYVYQKYEANILRIVIVTNGTINPRQQLIESFKKNHTVIEISDYSDNLPDVEKSVNAVHSVLKENGIDANRRKYTEWLSLGPPNYNQDLSDIELENRLDNCRMPCRSLYEGKLFFCGPVASAQIGKIRPIQAHEYLELNRVKISDKEDFFLTLFNFEFSFRNRFFESCNYCNGFGTANKNYVCPAKQ
ncbi:radical SAM protein [Fusibacter sp. 3D3]|uniref:radical SAM protein n=1 Tax=Fusibacter sp. 3D3 TaxID=1048380 RepID=UPI0008529264|nr:radical SAM protein [Fusibacter sp. 3D3]GAU75659.1 radical SAM domain protein protein [Fusibacter sp. 3D3]